jgi:chemotaxis protein methyltransferase CheR
MAISSSEFQYLQNLLVTRSGVLLAEKEKYLVEARLVPLVRTQKAASITDLIGKVKNAEANGLAELLLESLLPKDTAFFRDIHPFDLLKSDILRTLEMKRFRDCRLRIWCAGCSSGQEAYSIAMLLHRYCSQLLSWDVEILATDLSTEALDKGAEGRFDEVEVHRGVQPILVREYFRQNGTHYIIKEDVGGLVRFDRMNLIEEWPEMPQADIVFMRNVLRYLRPQARQQVLTRLKAVLKPDGYLFLGAQESATEIDSSYSMVPMAKTVYFQPSAPRGSI